MAFGDFGYGLILIPEKTVNYINNDEHQQTRNEITSNVKNYLLDEI